MFTIAITALIMGILFAAVGLLPGIYITAFVMSVGCFIYAIYERMKENSETAASQLQETEE